jgi:hypothetical protein
MPGIWHKEERSGRRLSCPAGHVCSINTTLLRACGCYLCSCLDLLMRNCEIFSGISQKYFKVSGCELKEKSFRTCGQEQKNKKFGLMLVWLRWFHKFVEAWRKLNYRYQPHCYYQSVHLYFGGYILFTCRNIENTIHIIIYVNDISFNYVALKLAHSH